MQIDELLQLVLPFETDAQVLADQRPYSVTPNQRFTFNFVLFCANLDRVIALSELKKWLAPENL